MGVFAPNEIVIIEKQYYVELCGIGYKELAKDRLILNIKSTQREGGY